MEHLPKRQAVSKKVKSRRFVKIFFINVSLIYCIMLSSVNIESDILQNFAQNFGSIIISVGISFPALYTAVFLIKWNKATEEQEKSLRDDMRGFVAGFIIFIVINTISYIGIFSASHIVKLIFVSFMLGALIAITAEFWKQVSNLLRDDAMQ
ncbi:hypothetical protein J31TS6_62730 [Brevibacillus reuszeri]|uniref:hypothetical protein n=1 Tax=Brevibacillus reuszeri TaxID=54915 RepID=UPI001B049D3F|nr:hypothetical protein [Brevibacillus reuszeri]GIO10245.1 hypothetical protein J31TS6_62730 [Brevibacillus reuszeri]